MRRMLGCVGNAGNTVCRLRHAGGSYGQGKCASGERKPEKTWRCDGKQAAKCIAQRKAKGKAAWDARKRQIRRARCGSSEGRRDSARCGTDARGRKSWQIARGASGGGA